MLENIFISTELDIIEQTLMIEYKRRNLDVLVEEVNNNPGYLFIYNNKDEKLNIAKIKKVYLEKNYLDKEKFIKLEWEYGFIYISYYPKFEIHSVDILKYLYARSNIHRIGELDKSIYKTLKIYEFSFSRPIINDQLFNNKEISLKETFSNHNKLESKLLYEGMIIPSTKKEYKTYAILIEEDGDYFFSLTNNKMLFIDYQYVNGEYPEEYPEYRPYFYDFYPNNGGDLKDFYSNNDSINLFEVSFMENNNNEVDATSKERIGGTVVFSASPIKTVSAYVTEINVVRDQSLIDKIINLNNKTKSIIKTEKCSHSIESEMMNGLIKTKHANVTNELTINNIGQGNWLKIDFIDKRDQKNISSIVFDIGIGNSPSKDIKKIAEQAVQDLKGHYSMMLSHWDQDHIKGIVYLSIEQFEKLWIVPALPNVNMSLGALRLAAFLYCNPKINCIFVDEKFNNKVIFENDYFTLGKGDGKNSNVKVKIGTNTIKTRYNNKNNLGLLLAVKNNKNKILLTGDCEYIQIPSTMMKNKYKLLLVSHHGAETNIPSLSQIGFTKVSNDSTAIVCVGKNTKYPNKNHVKMIEKLGYKVNKTRDFNSYFKKYKF